MRYKLEKLKMKEIVGGFTERDINSKALLNTDKDSFLKYKIQKSKFQNGPKDVEKIRNEMQELKNELNIIKEMLSTILMGKQ